MSLYSLYLSLSLSLPLSLSVCVCVSECVSLSPLSVSVSHPLYLCARMCVHLLPTQSLQRFRWKRVDTHPCVWDIHRLDVIVLKEGPVEFNSQGARDANLVPGLET
jgi:hypothetical protein